MDEPKYLNWNLTPAKPCGPLSHQSRAVVPPRPQKARQTEESAWCACGAAAKNYSVGLYRGLGFRV